MPLKAHSSLPEGCLAVLTIAVGEVESPKRITCLPPVVGGGTGGLLGRPQGCWGAGRGGGPGGLLGRPQLC